MSDADLVVIGRNLTAVSLAVEARQAGLDRIVVVDDGSGDPPPEMLDFDLMRGAIEVIETRPDSVVLRVGDQTLEATALATVSARAPALGALPPAPSSLEGRIHAGGPLPQVWGHDVLVVGGSEQAALTAHRLSAEAAGVVLCRGRSDPGDLSRLVRSLLLRGEAERRLTILWHSRVKAIEDLGGFPLVVFDDVGVPDLVFDHVVFAGEPAAGEAIQEGPVFRIGVDGLVPGTAWETIRRTSFSRLPPAARPERSPDAGTRVRELREAHYNATITAFERTHSDLWVIRVKPDRGDVGYEAGQYASLGLGYWEPRADAARDPGLERKWENLVRRSYSISSPIFDERGYLADPVRQDALEFYIVLVPAAGERTPALTPRLALRKAGDRIYVGPRIVGRYTLAPVTDPEVTVVLLATGTGEAPHNAMAVELLRKGHTGPIVAVVSVRYTDDLAYLAAHRRLEERFANYHYLPLVTREPDVDKLYIQDVIRRELLTERFGVKLDPSSSHVFLCGNPAMIGLPTWTEGEPQFPSTIGACQLLAERGFDLDRHGHVGTVHSEKYW